jgi:hypothetical protein
MSMLTHFVKDRRGRRVGVVVALSRDQIGWSKCNMNLDRYNEEFGMDVAIDRARKRPQLVAKLDPPSDYGVYLQNNFGGRDWRCTMPSSVKPIFEKMKDRAARYFKQTEKV